MRFYFKALGGACIEGEAGPLRGPIAQRRRLALLALLAASPTGRMSRDKIMAYLWPEADPDHARSGLADALYVLRKTLGKEAILPVGDELHLNSDLVRTDVAEFGSAIADGGCEQAIALYKGPFLDGFHLKDALEFGNWVDAERERLASSYELALEALAAEREAKGDFHGAAERWRTLAAEDPFSSRVALRLMQALVAAGDRAGALRHARVHAELLEEELGVEPDLDVLSLVERLRESGEPNGAHAPARPESAELVGQPEPGPAPTGESPAEEGSRPEGVRQPDAQSPPAGMGRLAPDRAGPARALRYVRPAAVVTLLAALITVGFMGLRSRAKGGPAPASTIAVLPFTVHGGEGFTYLRAGMAYLLSANLDGLGGLRSVDPHALLTFLGPQHPSADPDRAVVAAEHFDARLYVLGDIVVVGDRLRVTVSLYDRDKPEPGPIAAAQAEGEARELFDLVDRLSAELVAGRGSEAEARLLQAAAVTTASLPAFKRYLEGEAELRAGRYGSAIEAFEDAVSEDSTFALAHYRLSIAADWAGRPDLERDAAERATRHAGRLSAHDRLLLDAHLASLRGRFTEAERLYREIVAAHPADLEAWYRLGELLFHLGPPNGYPASEARPAFERVLALNPSQGLDALLHLARIASLEGDDRALDSLVARALALNPGSSERLQVLALRALARRDSVEMDQVRGELRHASDLTLLNVVWNANVYSRHFPRAMGFASLMTDPARPRDVQALGHLLLAHLELGQGRRQAAEAELRAAEALEPVAAMEYRAMFTGLPFVAASQSDLADARRALEDQKAVARRSTVPIGSATVHDDVHPHLRLYLLGLLSAGLGDHASAERYAVKLERLPGPPEAGNLAHALALGIRARISRNRGNPEEALALLDQAPLEVRQELIDDSPFYSRANERYLRAEILASLGQPREALRWFGSFAAHSSYDLLYLAPGYLRQGEIHEELDEPQAAADNYARFIELWKNCDPELRPLLERAERGLERVLERSG